MKKPSTISNIKLIKYKNPYITKNWIKWLNDKEVTKYSDQRFKKHTFISQRKYLKKLKANNTVFFKIYFKQKEIGNIFLTNIDENNENCEIAYLIGEKSLWNKGIATFIVKLMIKYAFKNLKIKKIY